MGKGLKHTNAHCFHIKTSLEMVKTVFDELSPVSEPGIVVKQSVLIPWMVKGTVAYFNLSENRFFLIVFRISFKVLSLVINFQKFLKFIKIKMLGKSIFTLQILK